MASPENATSVSLRPEGVDTDGRKIPGQKEILVAWKEEKLFRLSPFVRDCLEILERHPELLDAARPGLELSRALGRAEEMERLLRDIRDEAEAAHQNDRSMDTSHLASVIDMALRGAPRER